MTAASIPTPQQEKSFIESLGALKLRAKTKRMSDDTHCKRFVHLYVDFSVQYDGISAKATRKVRQYAKENGWVA